MIDQRPPMTYGVHHTFVAGFFWRRRILAMRLVVRLDDNANGFDGKCFEHLIIVNDYEAITFLKR